MKSFYLACFLALAGTATAQQNAVISGQITEPTHDSVRVSYYTNLVDFSKQVTAVALQPDGNFSVTVPLKTPVAAFLEHNYDIIELYLQPGDQLNVEFDTQEIDETIKFTGKGALENTCIAEISRRFQDDADFNYSKRNIYANDQEYLKLVDGKFGWQEKYAEKYLNKNPVSEPFKKWLRSEIAFGSALQKLQYTELRGTIAKIENPYQVSPGYYSFIAAAEAYSNPDNNSLCYINYKHELLKYEYRKTNTNPEQPAYHAGLYQLAKELLSNEPEAIITGRIVIDAYKNGHVYYADQILADYKKQTGNKPYVALVENTGNYLRPLARGSKAPALPMFTIDGKQTTLESLQGKAVYLYFYTLGCGSCQMEVVGARELARRLDDKNIAFVFVSVDQDKETWQKVVNKRPWPGLVVQTTDSAATTSNYRLSQYPRALILDADGRIFDKNAKRINSQELEADLEAVLNEKRNPVQGQLLDK